MLDPDISSAEARRLLSAPIVPTADDVPGPRGWTRRTFLQALGAGVFGAASIGTIADQFFGDVGLEVHDGRLHGLAKRELPWPAYSAIPDDALFDTRDDLIELCWSQSCSSLAWQLFLRGRRLFGDDPRIIPLEPLRYPLRHANSLTFSSHFYISLIDRRAVTHTIFRRL